MKLLRAFLLALLAFLALVLAQTPRLFPLDLISRHSNWTGGTGIALADSPFVTLLPRARADYRFDYKGDRTSIRVSLDTGGIDGVELDIYTPAQIQAAGRGQPVAPIARGTHNRVYDSFWSGSFPAPGVYEVGVENHTDGIVLYQLTVTGESVANVAPMLAAPPPAPSVSLSSNTLTVNLPPGAGSNVLHFAVPARPSDCTHSSQVPPTVSSSLRLCPNEIYAPLHLVGNRIALYGDDAHSAVITSGGRQFAVVVDGSNNLIEGVTIQSSPDAADQGAWLCQYDECIFPTRPKQTVLNGGILYGGGILLRASNSVIHHVTVQGGTIGIATVNGVGNALVENQLNDLNGWGSFNVSSSNSYFLGNTFNRENHACKTPDGNKFLHGCETAGWICLGCQGNLVARNHCEGSGNCYYMSGERGLASNNNRLIANYCAGATDNCFELTFSHGNLLQDNITTSDPLTGAACKYPFWIGGSTVLFKGNSWQCGLDADTALADAVGSTTSPTAILDSEAPVVAQSPSPKPTRIPHFSHWIYNHRYNPEQ